MADEVPALPDRIQAFVEAHWVGLSLVGCLVLAPLSYIALASALAPAALVLTSLATLGIFLFTILIFFPVTGYITWSRRMEVFSYRALSAVAGYLVVGVVVVLVLNQFSPRTIPLDWPEAQRFVPFWPFYAWLVTGCELAGFLPCPPPPG